MTALSTSPMPAIFFGHGSPGNVLEDNAATQCWARLGREFPNPKGIICISAHWYTEGVCVTAMKKPRTIHDFGGFSKSMYEMQYPAPGSPKLARLIEDTLSPTPVFLDDSWGLDHGTWCVLSKAYPEASIPVVQVSLDARQPMEFHYEVGQKLSALRDEGYLIAGSGNIVHNLPMMDWSKRHSSFDWAERFGDFVRDSIEQNTPEKLVHYQEFGEEAALSVPEPDHYLPLLYVIGARRGDDQLRFETNFVEYGSLDMTSVILSAP